MATKYIKENGTEKLITAQNDEIFYLKTKIYQQITTNRHLKNELYNANRRTRSLKNNQKIPKCTHLKGTEKRIAALNEEIHYLKTKIYQLIASNKTLKKELSKTKHTESDEMKGWKKIIRRKQKTQPTCKNDQ